MKLVIKEYLSTLKESGELDALLPDLLLNMGIVPQSEPQKGYRQYGVDVSAVGIDPEDGKEKLFLITIKEGDVTRSNWNNNEQDVRPSLDDILDVYIQQQIDPQHEDLPIKIVLACNGIREQNILPSWKGYTQRNQVEDELEFEFWGINELTELIDEFYLDEYLFSEHSNKLIRKTLALIDDNDYDLAEYFEFIESILDSEKLSTEKSRRGDLKRSKAFRLLNLSLNIIFKWAKDGNNIKPVLKCGERLIISIFLWLKNQELLERKKAVEEFQKVINSYIDISYCFLNKIKPNVNTRGGLYQAGQERYDYPIICFEILGILSTVGLLHVNLAHLTNDEEYRLGAVEIARYIKVLLNKNPGAKRPLYDEHGIDICLGLLLLHQLGMEEDVNGWIKEQLNRLISAIELKQHYPVSSDSYKDIIDREYMEQVDHKEFIYLSTLIPMLVFWLAIIKEESFYLDIQSKLEELKEDIDYQLWLPEVDSENYLLAEKLVSQTGKTLTTIRFPDNYDEFLILADKILDADIEPNKFKSIEFGFPFVFLCACRHFRNPVPPFFFISLIKELQGPRQCREITNSGNRCTRKVNENEDYCWQHKN